jgi:hypothetical protein
MAVQVDAALVFDSSRSMRSNDPGDLRIAAAQRFAQAMKTADRASVTDFDDRGLL